ncbi:hypothetical protein [Brachybacterium hainanense]|uniref:Uncharacterized protein n=1 Tax=Brachybacterium hainanense TaxID=1541174 RepID=A0ABV6RFT7_9MICO
MITPPENDQPTPSAPADDAAPLEADPSPAGSAPDAEDPAADPVPVPEGTVLLVRRERAPTLGFWVVLAMMVAAGIGVIAAVVTDTLFVSGILRFAATSAVFIGLPLAAIAAVADSVRHRRRERRR